MINRVVLVGRLTRDPDLRYTPSGIAVANFTVACNRPFKNEQGESEADFINCVTWRKQAENLAHYMKKGSMIGVDGRIQTRTYDNSEGKRVWVTEVLAESIQFLEYKKDSESDRVTVRQEQQQKSETEKKYENDFEIEQIEAEPVDISDDELPF